MGDQGQRNPCGSSPSLLRALVWRGIAGLSTLFLFGVAAIPAVHADFNCTVDVGYKWRKAKEEDRTVHWSAVAQSGSTEEFAKTKVQSYVAKEKAKADAACRNEHENLAGCIAGKYQAVGRTVDSLDWKAKRDIQDAIKADCTNQQGTCLEANLSEVKCEEVKAAPAEDAAAADGAAGGKKDEKKKK